MTKVLKKSLKDNPVQLLNEAIKTLRSERSKLGFIVRKLKTCLKVL